MSGDVRWSRKGDLPRERRQSVAALGSCTAQVSSFSRFGGSSGWRERHSSFVFWPGAGAADYAYQEHPDRDRARRHAERELRRCARDPDSFRTAAERERRASLSAALGRSR
jgi:hypothetical protein